MIRTRFVLLLTGLLLVASCSASDVAPPTGAEDGNTERETLPPCPNPHGGVCLGTLSAGTHNTSSFEPAITYTVPDGWSNLEDLPGNFLLEKPNDVRYLAIYQNVRAPAECDETWASGVEGTVEDLVAWFEAHPGLTITEPQEVTIGGLDGMWFDISLDPSWQVVCPFSEGQPVVPFIIGNGISQVHHVILTGVVERLYLLAWNGGNVAIEVGAEGEPLDEYLDEVLPIIEALRFES